MKTWKSKLFGDNRMNLYSRICTGLLIAGFSIVVVIMAVKGGAFRHADYGKALRKAAYIGDIQTVRTILRNHPDVINSFRGNPGVWSLNASRTSTSNGSPPSNAFAELWGFLRRSIRTQFSGFDEAGYSALDLAVRGNQPEVVSILLDNRADATHLNASNYRALHQAVQLGSVEILKQFLIHNADLEVKDPIGGTPLGWAVLCQHKAIAELLIAHGANINGGDTPPLHWAAEVRSKPMAQLLIQNGARINLRDKWQRTPLTIAVHKGDDALATFLREQGAGEVKGSIEK